MFEPVLQYDKRGIINISITIFYTNLQLVG